MKKVFLSLAVIAALTVVSCKQAEAPAEEVVTEEVAPVAEEVVADSTAVVADSTATPAAPAAEEKK